MKSEEVMFSFLNLLTIIVKILVSRLVMIMFGDVVRIVLNSFHTFNKSRSKS